MLLFTNMLFFVCGKAMVGLIWGWCLMAIRLVTCCLSSLCPRHFVSETSSAKLRQRHFVSETSSAKLRQRHFVGNTSSNGHFVQWHFVRWKLRPVTWTEISTGQNFRMTKCRGRMLLEEMTKHPYFFENSTEMLTFGFVVQVSHSVTDWTRWRYVLYSFLAVNLGQNWKMMTKPSQWRQNKCRSAQFSQCQRLNQVYWEITTAQWSAMSSINNIQRVSVRKPSRFTITTFRSIKSLTEIGF